MILDKWDHRVHDLIKAGETFASESSYGIKFSPQNTLNTLWQMFNDPDTTILLDYSDDILNGFAIVQRTNEFHEEYFGYLSKFYVMPDRRRVTRAGKNLTKLAVDWFDSNECYISFATATAEIGRDPAFCRLLSLYGYIATGTGVLIRKRHE